MGTSRVARRFRVKPGAFMDIEQERPEGRPPTRGEGVSARSIALTPSQWPRIMAEAATMAEAARRAGNSKAKPNLNDAMRRIVDFYFEEKEKARKHPRQLPLLGTAPAGPFTHAVTSSELINIGDAADEFRTKQDDFVIKANGFSLVSDDVRRHIPDQALLVMRLFQEPEGKICLVRAELPNGEYLWTIKRVGRDDKGKQILRDGKGNKVDIPEGTTQGIAVAVCQGFITSQLDVRDEPLRQELDELYEQLDRLPNIQIPEQLADVARQFNWNSVEEFAQNMLERIAERPIEETHRYIFRDERVMPANKLSKFNGHAEEA